MGDTLCSLSEKCSFGLVIGHIGNELCCTRKLVFILLRLHMEGGGHACPYITDSGYLLIHHFRLTVLYLVQDVMRGRGLGAVSY